MIRSLRLLPEPGPLRAYALANLVNTTGSGLYLTGSALYFTRVVGLQAGQVATGLAIATGIGVSLMVVFGRLADRWGAKQVYVTLMLVQSGAMACFTLVHGFTWFLVVLIPSGIADRGIAGTAGALVHAVAAGGSRTAARAQMRASTNIGLGLGTLLAGAALAVGTRSAYTTLVAGNAVLFLVSACLIARIRLAAVAAPGRPQPGNGSSRSPLRDGRYLAVAGANGLMSIYTPMMSFAIPLWIVGHTHAPVWSVSAILLVSTVMVVLLQVRVSAAAETLEGARRYARVAGLVFALGCLLLFMTPHLDASGALIVLLAWSVVITFGELLQSSSQFYCGFELAPDEAQGSYQSVFALGPGLMRAAGPWILTVVVLDHGSDGWLILAALFALSGYGMASAARWAAADRLGADESAPARALVGAQLNGKR
jgi:MFS family permease